MVKPPHPWPRTPPQGWVQHDPTTCNVCLSIGAYDQTPNKAQWHTGHTLKGMPITLIPNGLQYVPYEPKEG